MTAGIKRMLAEREQVKVAKARIPPGSPSPEILAMIDLSAEFIDAGCPPNKWPSSAKLKVAYFAMCSGQTGPNRAKDFILKMLDRARARFIAGFHPDPWLGDVPRKEA